MKIYTVATLGTGTDADPIRPDLPIGTSFVGCNDTKTNTYLVVVPDADVIVVKAGRKELSTEKDKKNEINVRKLLAADMSIWRVG